MSTSNATRLGLAVSLVLLGTLPAIAQDPSLSAGPAHLRMESEQGTYGVALFLSRFLLHNTKQGMDWNPAQPLGYRYPGLQTEVGAVCPPMTIPVQWRSLAD